MHSGQVVGVAGRDILDARVVAGQHPGGAFAPAGLPGTLASYITLLSP